MDLEQFEQKFRCEFCFGAFDCFILFVFFIFRDETCRTHQNNDTEDISQVRGDKETFVASSTYSFDFYKYNNLFYSFPSNKIRKSLYLFPTIIHSPNFPASIRVKGVIITYILWRPCVLLCKKERPEKSTVVFQNAKITSAKMENVYT